MAVGGFPIRRVVSGGIRVTEALNGLGAPYVDSPTGVAVTFTASGGIPLRNTAVPTYLPTVSAAPSFAIGTSKLIAAYAGPAARVQRISDDVESDLSFGSKFMDVSGLTIGSHGIKTVYDQTGNTNHITMATKANQPSGSNLLVNGCPMVHFDSSDLAINTIAKWMACASGPITEKSAFTQFVLLAPAHSFNDNYYTCQPPGATTLSTFTQSNNVGLRQNNTSPFLSTRKMPRNQPIVVRSKGGPSGKQFAVNGASPQTVATAPVSGTETGISLGHHFTTASFDGKFDLMACVIYNATLSDADCLLVEAALYAQCNVLTSASNLVIFDGDSRTQGAGRTLNETWEKKLLAGTSKTIHSINMGVGGQTLSSMAGAVAARVTALYDAAYAKNIVVLGGPAINDFTANRTALQAQADIQTYATALNAGQTLVVATCPLRDTSTAPQNAERVAYNVWLKANYASLKAGTVLVDLDALFPVWNSTDYIDIVHFKDAGQTKWAAAILPVLATLLV